MATSHDALVRGADRPSVSLDDFVASLRAAKSRVGGLRGLVEAALDEKDLVAALAEASAIRDDVIALAAAEAAWLSGAAHPRVVLEIADEGAVERLYLLHLDISERIDELRGLVLGLATVAAAGATHAESPPSRPPEEWGSGDVFAEVYR